MMKLIARIFAAALMLLSGSYVWAQTAVTIDEAALQSYSVQGVADRYPAGTIKSQETADSALEDVKQARANIEARFNAEQQACYPKFFTTSCLNKAKERRRLDLLIVKPVEVEANSYIRHARVIERDRRQAEKAAENEGKAILQQMPEGTAGTSTHEQHGVSRDAQRKARADAQAEKIEKQAEKEKSLKENEAAEEKKRAENIKRYEEKVKASAARQKEIQEKKAEKERARQQK